MHTNKKIIFLLLGLSFVLFFFRLGHFSLYDAAETTYGEFIKQIRLTGDWITPYYNGQVLFDKPPLYFWLSALATFVFGFNEFALRFWAAVCGILTTIATFYLGNSLYNRRTGFYAAMVIMTAFQFMVQSRIAEIDILLTFLITASLLFFSLGYQNRQSRFYLVSYLCMGLALLVKGILGIALPGFTIFLVLCFKKELYRLKEMRILIGILIILIVGGSWYLAAWLIHGQKFTAFVLGFLLFARFQGAVCGHAGPWYYYFIALLLGFAPWSHFLPYAISRTWQERALFPAQLILAYIIPTFLVFSIAQTKLPNYVLPLYPFLAIMVGKLWDDFLGEQGQPMRRGMALANLFLAMVVGLLIVAAIIAAKTNYQGQYQEMIPQLLILMVILILGTLSSIIFYAFRKYRLSFAALPVTVFIIMFYLTLQMLPAVENYKGLKCLGEKVWQVILPGQQIGVYDIGNRPGVVFYNKQPVVYLNNFSQVDNFIRSKAGYVFITTDQYAKQKEHWRLLAQKADLAVVY